MSDPSGMAAGLQDARAAATTTQRLWRLVLRVLRLHRYPRYLADLSATHLLPLWLGRAGLTVGNGTRFFGFPIISLAPGSVIEIGRGCYFISRSTNTALGVNHRIVLRTLRPEAELRIGTGVRMSGTTICAAERVVIGDRCVIGANATIVDTDFHSLDPAVRSSRCDADHAAACGVEIADDVFIGGGSYVLKGVRIDAGAVVGAGSVVTRSVSAGIIVAGNPARRVGIVADPVCGSAGKEGSL